MILIQDNLFNYTNICIPTNGIVKQNGEAVTGKGLAKEANKFTFNGNSFSCILGKLLTKQGNNVFDLGFEDSNKYRVFTFPTKHHWRDNSDIELIKKSFTQLSIYKEIIALPIVGSGCGRLNKNLIIQLGYIYLADNFIMIEEDKEPDTDSTARGSGRKN